MQKFQKCSGERFVLHNTSNTRGRSIKSQTTTISDETKILYCQGLQGRAYRGLTGGFLLLRNFSFAISVCPHVCFILVLILISMFLR